MLVLGIETSCDDTGVALYDSTRGKPDSGLIAQAVHSQTSLHDEYGGVVPELASRDHVRRLLPLVRQVMTRAGAEPASLDAVAYTAGPGLAGALLVGAGFACSFAYALKIPAVGIHHLEGHLLSALLAPEAPEFPFLALLVSGGHTQLMRVSGVGSYALLGETADDAAGEAFDKTAKLLGLPYPGGPALADLAGRGRPERYRLPRPMIGSGNLDFSFSGLKTAVLQLVREHGGSEQARADIACAFQKAVVDVLATKCVAAVRESTIGDLVVAGGVGANRALRAELDRRAKAEGFRVHYPPQDLCTDNGAMIALAGALRLQSGHAAAAATAGGAARYAFPVRPRWALGT